MRTVIFFILFQLVSIASMLPQNNILRAPLLDSKNEGVNTSKAEYDNLLALIERTYLPVFKKLGVDFSIIKKWEDATVNAGAGKAGNDWRIIVYGGLARHKSITDDGFLLVVCHEVGHLIGGAPTWKPRNEISSEGQADYFSTSKCLRRVIRGENHQLVLNNKSIDPIVLDGCSQIYQVNSEDYNICLRTSLASISLARLIEFLRGLEVGTLSYSRPDPRVRGLILFNDYPSPQCRLDTLFAGSLCDEAEDIDLDINSYNYGVCSKVNGHTYGLRPKCWYVERDGK